MLDGIYNNIDFYKKALDGTWTRNKAISSNIANDNVPNYKRKIVTFEEQLKQSMNNRKVVINKTHKKHIGIATDNFTPQIIEDKSISYRLDKNNVNIDTETADLAKNTIMYDALIRQVIGEIGRASCRERV